MPQFTFTLRVKPEAQKRVKVYNRIAVDPSKQYKAFLKMQLLEQWKFPPFKGATSLYASFIMPIPKSTSKKKQKEMREYKIPHVKKCDLDNMIKALLDAMNGVVLHDDSQVWEINAEKVYGIEPRIEVYITLELNEWEKFINEIEKETR